MTGRTPFQILRDQMTPEQQVRAAAKAATLREELSLTELRQARDMTQAGLSETLHVDQSAISKLEKRTDMYVGTLRRYINAMGGELDIVARFPDGDVKISNFAGIGEAGDIT